MEGTSACIRQMLQEMELSDSSKMLTGSSDSKYFSGHSESMIQERTGGGSYTSIEEQIEQSSKSHWSQVVDSDSDEEEAAEVSNLKAFKDLQKHPTWGGFFTTFREGSGRSLVVGEKFAEGGQAEIYEAQVKWLDEGKNEKDLRKGREYVLKVFKKGCKLRHLQSQWPVGLFQLYAQKVATRDLGKFQPMKYRCEVDCGTLLQDGRFAFVLAREHCDLRTLIERNMLQTRKDPGPFCREEAEWIMYRVAVGMNYLHSFDIVHRDLKASNVLIKKFASTPYIECYVADYECSIGVVGTGFFRAPEILQACKDNNLSKRSHIFTKQVDVYGYGMTCYEILTGKLPFQECRSNDYDIVLDGQRPLVPEYVDDWVHRLLNSCWQANPTARPTFGEILNVLSNNSERVRRREERRRKRILEEMGSQDGTIL